MRIPTVSSGPRGGFALIVTLSALAILTIIFSVASSRTMSRLQDGASERLLAERRETGRDLLELALQLKSSVEGRELTTFAVEIGGTRQEIFLQDVGGLIDLNTASPEVLEKLIEAFDLGPGAFEAYHDWRRSQKRLLRVGDFLRVTGGDPAELARLRELATVHSGRRGVAPDLAPPAVLELLTGRNGGREALAEVLPPGWVSQSSGANYAVIVVGETGARRRVGVVHIGQGAGDGRVLSAW